MDTYGDGATHFNGKRHSSLSITHISFGQQESELDVREPAKAAPHDRVAWWSVIVPGQVTSQPSDT